MTMILRASARIYAAVLPLYPPGLRRDFGPEMTDAFTEDLEDSWRARGLPGVIWVWRCFVWEFFRIAIPYQTENPAVAVPVTLFALSEALLSAELMLALRHTSGDSHVLLEAIPGMALGLSITAALTSLVVVLAGNRSLPAPLGLRSDTCSKSAI